MRITRGQAIGLLARLAAAKRGFQTPPEVVDYFRDKNLKPAFSWLDVWGEEHAHGFTVAGVTETRVLNEFKAAIDKAIAGGKGFAAFQEDMKARLTPMGWWGPKTVSDPTGKWADKTVDFTRPGRLQTTFWANVRSARAAGQWNRIQRTKESRPFLLYVRSTAERKRPEHLAVAGTIKPVDDSWWGIWFPPNGWGCQCKVQQLDREDRDRYLAQEGYSEDAPDLGTKSFVNRRTGEVTQIPRGIDPGWHTNSGLARAQTLTSQLSETLAEAGPERAAATIAKLWRGNWPKALAKLESVELPVAASARAAEQLKVESGLVTVANDVVEANVVGKPGAIGIESFGLVQRIIDQGEWTTEGDRRLVAATIDGVPWVAEIEQKDGALQLLTLAKRKTNKRRRTPRPRSE